MKNSTELRQVAYSVLLTQIQFGAYRYGEKLPTIEETSARLCVSIDTARAAYLKLKEDGYITLLKMQAPQLRLNIAIRKQKNLSKPFCRTQACDDRSWKSHAASVRQRPVDWTETRILGDTASDGTASS